LQTHSESNQAVRTLVSPLFENRVILADKQCTAIQYSRQVSGKKSGKNFETILQNGAITKPELLILVRILESHIICNLQKDGKPKRIGPEKTVSGRFLDMISRNGKHCNKVCVCRAFEV